MMTTQELIHTGMYCPFLSRYDPLPCPYIRTLCSISENGATITIVDVTTGAVRNVTLPCSPKCAMVWALTSYPPLLLVCYIW